MLQAKTVVRKEINNYPYLFINLVFTLREGVIIIQKIN